LFLVGLVTSILGELLGWGTQYPFGPGPVDVEEMFGVSAEYTILSVVIGGVYFIASWSGGRRATLGQRIFQIQVGNAFDGRPLRLDQAVRRWLGFGDFAQMLGIVPSAAARCVGTGLCLEHRPDHDGDEPDQTGPP
jgi:uncharacterized RDD family membrane protein YckC